MFSKKTAYSQLKKIYHLIYDDICNKINKGSPQEKLNEKIILETAYSFVLKFLFSYFFTLGMLRKEKESINDNLNNNADFRDT